MTPRKVTASNTQASAVATNPRGTSAARRTVIAPQRAANTAMARAATVMSTAVPVLLSGSDANSTAPSTAMP